MSAHKHTPGPWVTALTDDTVIVGSDGAEIAEVSGNYDIGHAGMEANARLIAAAPELLDLARAIYRATNECLVVNNSHEDSVGVLFDAAQEVIAKATGESA